MVKRRSRPRGYGDVAVMLSALARRGSRGSARTRAMPQLRRSSIRASTRGRSYTRTRRARRIKWSRGTSLGEHLSKSGWRLRHKQPRWYRNTKKMTGTMVDYINGSTSAENDTGFQVMLERPMLLGKDLYRLASKYGDAGTNQTQKVFLETAKMKIEYTNFCSAPLRLKIYDVLPRHDLPMQDGVSENTLTPLYAWHKGMIGESATGAEIEWNANPFKSLDFTRTFRVMRVVNVTLDPGASHMHYVTRHVNRFIDPYRLGQLGQLSTSTGSVNLAKFTCHTLAVATGVPCVVSAEGADLGKVTTTAVNLGQVFEITANVRAVNPNYTSYGETTTLVHHPASEVKIIQVDNGDAEVEVEL